MGCMLRSDAMTLCDLFLQPDTAFRIVTQFGRLGCVEFLDMTPKLKVFERKFISEICRCAEMERKLFYIETELLKDNIHITEMEKEPDALELSDMIALENILEQWETQIRSMSDNHSEILKNYLELNELFYILNHIGPLLGDISFKERHNMFRSHNEHGDTGFSGHLYIITGVVKRTRCFPFEMMLWRISRGNIYYRQAAEDAILQEPATGQDVRKVAFVAVCQGEELSSRMLKVCSGFSVNLYTCPENIAERTDMIIRLSTRIYDMEHVIRKTTFHRCKLLRMVSKQWESCMAQIKKSKAVYYILNRCTMDITKGCLIGKCWIPDTDLPKVMKILEDISEEAGTNMPSFISKSELDGLRPPTHHRTNKFTHGFQMMISAYGVSSYRELNPGLYTIITFPFLFAVMFGDVCHGLIMVLFAGWMVVTEKKHMDKISKNEIWTIFFGGRYVILLMGLFSMYTGFLYNVYFSKSIILTPPFWINIYDKEFISAEKLITLDPALETKKPYIFGVDPIWALAKNKIMFLNSLKMKLSIIIGIIHMVFGLSLSLVNHLYFKKYYAIFLQFIPQIIFLTFLFMWLVAMIFLKWFMFNAQSEDITRKAGCAPSVLIYFIDMMLMSKTKDTEGCDTFMFPFQPSLQKLLVYVALLCVPILLLGTPIYLYRVNKKKRDEALKKVSQFRRYQRQGRTSKETEEKNLAEVRKYTVSFGELMIQQGVHTIEFVLSTISHTASYLRLWALSLAHEQLSEMLWEMVLSKLGLHQTSYFGIIFVFLIFAVWAFFSLTILVIMEGLSAFLHTLRLHWVEFMSKFFSGNGVLFQPFSFFVVLSGDAFVSDKPENICTKLIKH